MRSYLSILLLAALVAAFLWDWWAIVKGQPQDTVSAVILDWSQRWPVLPFFMGMAVGHLLWPNR